MTLAKYKLLMFLVALLVAMTAITAAMASPAAQDKLANRLAQQSEGKLQIDTYSLTGVARLVAAENGALTREFAGKGDAEAIARAFMGEYGTLMGVQDQSNLKLKMTIPDSLGMKHVRFTQTHNGIGVFAADIVVHVAKDGAVMGANGYMVPGLDKLPAKADLSAKAAAEIALKQLADVADAAIATSELAYLNAGIITEAQSESYLTYRIKVDSAATPERSMVYFIDAVTGDVRFSLPGVAEGRNRNTYNMKHGTNYGTATLARNETAGAVTSATSCTPADINNAHDYAGNTYDFYFSRFGRDSYNNAGAALNSYVCYSSNYQNAFWDGSRMTYGDGFAAADDVVSHELSHAVTEYASGLVYSNQSGALNESYSDIFGEAVDLLNGSGTDTSAVRWDMGEDIPGIGAIRDMMDPGRFSDPDSTTSSNYYCGTSDNGGVHINSGVPNKAFALMVDGGTFGGKTVTPIGIDKAVQIQYRANEVYLTSSAKMLDNYNALNRSCTDLVGSNGITTTDCANMKVALEAVKMNGAVCGTGGATATPGSSTPVPTATPTGPTPTPVPGGSITNGGFESGRNVGWTESDSLGYVLINTGSAYAGSWKAWLAGANNETSLISQNVTVPSGATLYYRYKITSTDSCGYDYGRVIVNSTTVKTHNLCTTTNSSSYVQGSVSLSAYAGQNVAIKFQATTDSSVVSSFYIDNVGFAPSLTVAGDEGVDTGIDGDATAAAKTEAKVIPADLGADTHR